MIIGNHQTDSTQIIFWLTIVNYIQSWQIRTKFGLHILRSITRFCLNIKLNLSTICPVLSQRGSKNPIVSNLVPTTYTVVIHGFALPSPAQVG